MAQQHRTFCEELELDNLIDRSVMARYDSEVVREDADDGALAIWGGVLQPEAIEDAFERLMAGTTERWPQAFCEEEEEEEEEERVRCADAEEWAREEHENWSARVELNIFSELDEFNYRQVFAD